MASEQRGLKRGAETKRSHDGRQEQARHREYGTSRKSGRKKQMRARPPGKRLPSRKSGRKAGKTNAGAATRETASKQKARAQGRENWADFLAASNRNSGTQRSRSPFHTRKSIKRLKNFAFSGPAIKIPTGGTISAGVPPRAYPSEAGYSVP